MKISEANLQLYRLDPLRPVSGSQPRKPAEVNPFSQARFAELLTDSERKFISQNFKPEAISPAKPGQLGRFIDVRA